MRTLRSLTLGLALAVLLAPTTHAADDGDRLIARTAGVYFSPEKGGGESTMEIAAYAPKKAYIRLHTHWGNGHTCSLYGMFEARSQAYVHEDVIWNGVPWKTLPCRTEITSSKGRFHIRVTQQPSGESLQACLGGCGARGTFDGEDRFTLKQGRPIRYLPRLRDSVEYAWAVKADRDPASAGPPP